LPALEWVGLPLNFGYANGKWFAKVSRDKEEEIGPTELFVADPRSYTELWKRLERLDGQRKKSITETIGGRRVDGWINPRRHLLPETDKTKWPLRDKDGEPDDPWIEELRIVLRRLSDDQLFTWSAQYSSQRGMGALLDAAMKDCDGHPGLCPVVILKAIVKGDTFIPDLQIVDWRPFGEGASPPPNPARAQQLQEDLRALHAKYAPKAAAAAVKKKRGDMDDEIPF